MSFKTEIKVIRDDRFYPNGVTFATSEEADKYGHYKLSTWSMAEKYQVAESTETPNYRWDDQEGLVALNVTTAA